MHQALTTDTATSAAAPSRRKKRWSRKKHYIIWGSVGLVVLWIIVSVIAGKREKPIPVTTEKAVRKTIVQTVSATGKVQPEVEVKISPEVAGEIIDLPVEDGKAVKKGDLLVRIKPDSRTTRSGHQFGESDEPSAEGDIVEDGTGYQAR